MIEADLQKRIEEFFLKNEAGQYLLSRWQKRVSQYADQLIVASDPKDIAVLQAKLQYHREVMNEVSARD